ncbi:MAG: phosphoglucomutase/phosphomannomutase family protein [Clostridia bacterium]|nr:phosphoglucomutase/phosphomannomutase family protein [Clostridia bacterium]
MIRFGTGGWRAIIGDEFTKDNICLAAQGFANLLHAKGLDQKKVIIGHDRRFLSDEAANWFAEVLTGNNIAVILMARSMPTPMIMHYVQKHELDFGIEITASHNPAAYNGIKIIVSEGRDAPIEFTAELESYIDKVTASDVKSKALPNEYSEILRNPFNDYIDDILAQLNIDAMRAHGARLLFNPMHGSGMYPLMCILYTVRCTVDPINYNRDAYFGGMMPAPAPHSLQDLTEQVVRGGYELGIALDGDGDRLGIIDADGTYIDANKILVMLYHYLHEYKGWKGPVVRNLATTHMLDKLAADLGEVCHEVPIGFKHISAKIDEVDAILGGESSGGLTVRGHIHGKDSVYAAALFVEMLSVIGMSPSAYYETLEQKYGVHCMVESNLSFEPAMKPAIVNQIMVEKQLPTFAETVSRVNYEDGCKVYFENGDFVICRFSGTEPLLRIFAESSTAEKAETYIQAFRDLVAL